MEDFKVSAGSVIGKYHLKTNKNNQDSYQYYSDNDKIIAVVCDGCGSAPYSEVGANLGAKLLLNRLKERNFWSCSGNQLKVLKQIRKVRNDVIKDILSFVDIMIYDEELASIIQDYFLFTSVCAVVCKNYSYIFSIGDGYYGINGETTSLGPFENNAPPYISYYLIRDKLIEDDPSFYSFKLNKIIKTEGVDSILLGTDGVEDIISNEDRNIPGKKDKIGGIEQFYDFKYVKNSQAITRRLNIINKNSYKVGGDPAILLLENGPLGDDTTILVIHRYNSAFKIKRTSDESLSEGSGNKSETDSISR